ncbi:MAG: peptidylprolyl isomerase [Bacteroidota bacterium]
MKMIHWIAVALFAFSLALIGCSPREGDAIVLEVGPTKVPLREYESFYARNSGGWDSGKRSTMEEREHFLDLLTDYKLKLQDAYDRNIPGDPELRDELRQYRSSLAATFIIDKEVTEPGIQSTYDRRHEEIRAQQILISVKNNAPAGDTLAAWEKATDIIKHAKAGEKFDSLALANSNDPTVKGNHGDVYYFTGGQMTVTFENAAYAMKKGEISSFPVRSPFGYHVIKILDRIPSRGSLKVSHIMARFKISESDSADTAVALQRIHAMQDSLNHGWTFAKLATKFSEDPGSAPMGGDLGWFERRRWVQPFDEACFKLAPGQTSGVVKTPFGYHIIRCDSLKPVPPLSELREDLKKRYQQNRYAEDYGAFIAKLKQDYHYAFVDSTFDACLTYLDSMKSIGDSAWAGGIPRQVREKTIMVINGKPNSLDAVLAVLDKQPEYRNTMLRRADLQSRVDRIAETFLLDEKSIGLESRSPEFASLMKEYEDGVVLFKAEQSEVWNNITVSDSALRNYFEQHKSKFMFPERVGYNEIHVSSDTLAFMIYDSLTHGASFGDMAARYNEDPELRSKRGARGLKPLDSDEQAAIATKLKIGEISEPIEMGTGGFSIITAVKRDPPREKTYEEAGAEVSNQYQEFLSKNIEQQWVDRLRQHYTIKQYKERLRDAFKSSPVSY